MTMIVCDAAKQRNLGYSVGLGTLPALVLRLYVNNVTPTDTSTAATFTECSATSYSSLALPSGLWTLSVISDVAQAVATQQTFTIGSACTIYGYYLTDSNNSNLLFGAELLANSIAYQAHNIQVLLTATLQMGDS
jgi:hypothetical protein